MRLKDKAAPLVTTKEIMPIKSNVTRLLTELLLCIIREAFSIDGIVFLYNFRL